MILRLVFNISAAWHNTSLNRSCMHGIIPVCFSTLIRPVFFQAVGIQNFLIKIYDNIENADPEIDAIHAVALFEF